MRLNPLGDDSDRSWDWFGKNDPYYGVVSRDIYRQRGLTDEALREFFATGDRHVDRVVECIHRHFGPISTESCLDFGSGVGRLVIPFSRIFSKVAGVDISPAMIVEAKRNCSKFGVTNAAFFPRLSEAGEAYNLVHSYIVIQHIPVKRGLAIIDQLIDKLGPSGVAFLHLTIGRNAGVVREIATFARKNFKPLHWALNVVTGKPSADAYMQSNRYQMNFLLAHLYDRGIRQIWMELENHNGPYSVCLAFQRSAV